MNGDAILTLSNISYAYEDKWAVKNINACFGRGEKVAILGQNGAGKSTFFLLCNGVLAPQKGQLTLKNETVDYSKKSLKKLRSTVGIVFQEADTQIIASTVQQEVSFGPMNLGWQSAQVKKAVEDALREMDLVSYKNRAPQFLSGGEKKRVTIADILAMNPEMILLDEPTASLDPANVLLLEKTLQQLHEKGICIVVSTHDIDFAYRFANRGLVFSKGEIIQDAPLETIFENQDLLTQAGIRKPIFYQMKSFFNAFKKDFEIPSHIKSCEALEAFCRDDITQK